MTNLRDSARAVSAEIGPRNEQFSRRAGRHGHQRSREKKPIFCFILPSFFCERIGGSELQCYYIAQELLRRGWQVHYIRETDHKPRQTQEYDGIKLHAIPRRRELLRWTNMAALARRMRDIKADVWYCRATISYLAPVVRAARRCGGKVIWACSHDNQIDGLPFSHQPRPINLTPAAVNRTFFARALYSADDIILQTVNQASRLPGDTGLRKHVLYNAHPLPGSSKDTNRTATVLWVGRLQTWKRPEVFAEIADRLSSKPYTFVIVGRPISNAIHRSIQQHAHANKKLRFLGAMPNHQTLRHVAGARLLVSTSEGEGFPNTFIEAWLRGVPTISLAVDPDGLIQKHGLGRVSRTIGAMVRDIDELMRDQVEWARMSARCVKVARRLFDIKQAVSKLEKLIAS